MDHELHAMDHGLYRGIPRSFLLHSWPIYQAFQTHPLPSVPTAQHPRACGHHRYSRQLWFPQPQVVLKSFVGLALFCQWSQCLLHEVLWFCVWENFSLTYLNTPRTMDHFSSCFLQKDQALQAYKRVGTHRRSTFLKHLQRIQTRILAGTKWSASSWTFSPGCRVLSLVQVQKNRVVQHVTLMAKGVSSHGARKELKPHQAAL